MTDPEIRKVFDRWAASEMLYRGRLIHTEPTFTANSVPGPADRPIPTYQIRDWRHARLIFAVRYKRRDYFPAFQFENGRPKAVVERVLKLLHLVRPIDSWYAMYWFHSANSWLDEEVSPVSVMDKDQEAIVEAAFHANELRIPAMPVHDSGASRTSIPVHAGLMCGGVGRVFENGLFVNGLCD